MLKLIETLRAKPSDKTIRIVRVVFALILTLIITLGIEKTHWNFAFIPPFLVYILYIFPLVGLVRGIFDPGLFRKKVWKWTIFGLGVAMMGVTTVLLETDVNPTSSVVSPKNVSGEISISATDIAQSKTPMVVDTDFWVGFLGFFVALIGFTLTSKNITQKNDRFGEKVTKIRV